MLEITILTMEMLKIDNLIKKFRMGKDWFVKITQKQIIAFKSFLFLL